MNLVKMELFGAFNLYWFTVFIVDSSTKILLTVFEGRVVTCKYSKNQSNNTNNSIRLLSFMGEFSVLNIRFLS